MASLSYNDYTVLPYLETPVVARMTFYTTADMECVWAEIYAAKLAVKQAEIDERERRTKKLAKFTACAFISEPSRVFHVTADGAISCNGMACPSAPTPGGRVYTLDPTFRKEIARFQTHHLDYSVEFRPTSSCLMYCNAGMAATLRSGDDELIAEDKDAYDLVCG